MLLALIKPQLLQFFASRRNALFVEGQWLGYVTKIVSHFADQMECSSVWCFLSPLWFLDLALIFPVFGHGQANLISSSCIRLISLLVGLLLLAVLDGAFGNWFAEFHSSGRVGFDSTGKINCFQMIHV